MLLLLRRRAALEGQRTELRGATLLTTEMSRLGRVTSTCVLLWRLLLLLLLWRRRLTVRSSSAR